MQLRGLGARTIRGLDPNLYGVAALLLRKALRPEASAPGVAPNLTNVPTGLRAAVDAALRFKVWTLH